ncbi:MAG: hypothetical protein P8P74_13040 [Crocinitomicaceae bacterium]|nr:hypothetical protein [Crocinitomicaceae bacterium]
MKRTIAEQDVSILKRLFIPETSKVDVFDPKRNFELHNLAILMRSKSEESRSLILSGNLEISMLEQNYDRVIQLDGSKGVKLDRKKEFRFIQVGGNVRWVYPKGKLKTVFDFYHASTRRAKMIRFGLKTLAALRLDFIISRKITVHSNCSKVLQKSPKGIPFTDFSIFMGTPGVERTVLVSLLNNNKSTAFLKVGLNSLSQYNVGSEGLVLFRLNRLPLEHIVVPEVKSTYQRGVLVLSKLFASDKQVVNSFQKEHVQGFLELTKLSRTHQRFTDSTFGEEILDNCSVIQNSSESDSHLGKLLLESIKGIPHNQGFSASLAHGDFTPWNMFISSNKLYVYDWELSIRNAPVLFDLFHFHFQTGIFIRNWSFNEIFAQIKFTIESHHELQEEIQIYSIDIQDQLELYLLYVASRKLALKIASREDKLINAKEAAVWSDAMRYVLPERENNRISFMHEFERFLSGVEHAFLKFNADSLASLPASSDLDIAIDKSSLDSAIAFCKNQFNVKRHRIVRKSFMTTVELFFNDGRYLSIDLIHDFRRKWLQFMNIKELLYFSFKNNQGTTVPSLEYDMEYTFLFYTLNGAGVPEKYLTLFKKASREDRVRVLRYFQNKYSLPYLSFDTMLNSSNVWRAVFELYFIRESSIAPLSAIKSRFNYLIDTIKEKIGKRGFILTVSGVDGVGKSTVIELVKEQLQSKYRKEVVLMRHRPKVLPILSTFKYGSVEKAESRSTHQDPSKVSKKSTLASYLRFSYYYFDYVFGQFYVHLRYVWGGKIVLYDRYYFDLINHPQRTNLVVNRKFAKWLYGPILKPSMNIFLNASPDEIVKRKQELTTRQISKLSDKYLSLFRDLSRDYSSSRYVVHRNDNLTNTVTNILRDIQQIA